MSALASVLFLIDETENRLIDTYKGAVIDLRFAGEVICAKKPDHGPRITSLEGHVRQLRAYSQKLTVLQGLEKELRLKGVK